MSTDNKGRSSYLDLLITTLMEHEKKTDRLLEKLEKIVKNLSTFEQTSLKTERSIIKEERLEEKSGSDTLIYVKIDANRPLHKALKIIESLKK